MKHNRLLICTYLFNSFINFLTFHSFDKPLLDLNSLPSKLWVD